MVPVQSCISWVCRWSSISPVKLPSHPWLVAFAVQVRDQFYCNPLVTLRLLSWVFFSFFNPPFIFSKCIHSLSPQTWKVTACFCKFLSALIIFTSTGVLCLWKTSVILAIRSVMTVWPRCDTDDERGLLKFKFGEIKGFSLCVEDAQAGSHIWILPVLPLSCKTVCNVRLHKWDVAHPIMLSNAFPIFTN